MDERNSWGQGLNALIPPKNNQSSNHQFKKQNDSSPDGLESRISQKVNQAFGDRNSQEITAYDQEIFSSTTKKEEDGIIPKRNSQVDNIDTKDKIFRIETELIKPNPQQPRQTFSQDSIQELADSIREYGIIEPLVVTRKETDTPHGTKVEYQLVAGERRLKAARLLGLPTVPVIIKKSLAEGRKLELALVENIQREDLSPIARAKAFARLMREFNLTQQALSIKIGKSREVIANTLRLLQLPLEAQQLLEEGKINEGHARAILSFSNPEKRRSFLREMMAKKLSGREALLLAQKYLKFVSPKRKNTTRRNVSLDPQDLERKEKLEDFFHVPVVIKKKGEQGEISIKFFSEEELEKILNKILSS